MQATGQQPGLGHHRNLGPVEAVSAAAGLAGGVGVENESRSPRIRPDPGQRSLLGIGSRHGHRLDPGQAPLAAKFLVLATMKLQQMWTQCAHHPFHVGGAIVHEQGNHADHRRSRRAQRLAEQQVHPSLAAGSEHQTDGVDAQLAGEADIAGPGETAEFYPCSHGAAGNPLWDRRVRWHPFAVRGEQDHKSGLRMPYQDRDAKAPESAPPPRSAASLRPAAPRTPDSAAR